MAQITWLGSSNSSPAQIVHYGILFPLNVPVESDNEDVLGKCWTNQFYKVEGWSPEDGGEQPMRSSEAMAPQQARRLPPATVARPKPPPLPEPPEEEIFPEDDELKTVTITDNGQIVDEDSDLPAIISGAQKVDIDGDGEPDIEIRTVEPAAEPAPKPRRRRRRQQ